jgi:hypothetical protein
MFSVISIWFYFMKKICFFLFLCLFSLAANSTVNKNDIFKLLKLNALGKNVKIGIECDYDSISIENGTITMAHEKALDKKRCEIALYGIPVRDIPFRLSFDFKVNNNFKTFNNSHVLFQVHGSPDFHDGESWRTPILALQSINGSLRMINWWDENYISSVDAENIENSNKKIKLRKLFSAYNYSPEKWYTLDILGAFSYKDKSCLQVLIDEVQVSNVCGFNTYNDKNQPYFKFGVYKPTIWEKIDEKIIVSYRNIQYQEF